LYPEIEDAYVRGSDAVLCTSSVLVDRVRDKGSTPVYLPNGVDLARLAAADGDAVRERLGLDRPIPAQYVIYVGKLLRGDLGTSIVRGDPVLTDLLRRFPATVELAAAAMALAVLLGLPIGIAISGCIDSNMALRDALWSHGSSIQNETGEVVINNKNTVETIKYIRALFKEAMDPEVLAWDDSSNNRAMEGGKISWTLNAISIARSIEKNNPAFFPKVQLWKPPRGPRNLGGKRLGSEHVFFSYAIWKFTPPEQKQLAKQFLVDYANNWGRAFVGSEFYEFPSFPGAVPNLKDQILHDGVAAKMGQPEKYKELTSALDWSTNVGFPGYANAAEGEVFDTYILPQMFALAATDRMSPEDASKWAEAQIAPIFAKWKARGLM